MNGPQDIPINIGKHDILVSNLIIQLTNYLKPFSNFKELMFSCNRSMIEHLLNQPKNVDINVTILKIVDSMISRKDYSNSLISRFAASIIPNAENLMECKSDKRSGLMPVKVGQPYIDSDDYLETYYRLTWADTFTDMRQGIKDYIGNLKHLHFN